MRLNGLVFIGMALLAAVYVIYYAAPAAYAQNKQDDKQSLAERYYDLNPSWKTISRAIRARAQSAEFNARQRLVFITAMEKLINKPAVKNAAIPVIADLFSEEELRALISFYENPHIQSSLAKQETFDRKLAPFVTKIMDEAYLKYKTGSR